MHFTLGFFAFQGLVSCEIDNRSFLRRLLYPSLQTVSVGLLLFLSHGFNLRFEVGIRLEIAVMGSKSIHAEPVPLLSVPSVGQTTCPTPRYW